MLQEFKCREKDGGFINIGMVGLGSMGIGNANQVGTALGLRVSLIADKDVAAAEKGQVPCSDLPQNLL